MSAEPRSLFHRPDVRVAFTYMVFAGTWILASDRLLELFSHDRALMVHVSTVKGIGFVLVTTVLLFLLLRVAYGPSSSRSNMRLPELRARNVAALVVGLGLVVPLIAHGIVRIHGPRLERDAAASLGVIAELKAGQIESWLAERRSDAGEIARSSSFAGVVEGWLSRGDPMLGARVSSRLTALAHDHGYTVELVDATGKRVFGTAAESVAPPEWGPLLAEAWRTGAAQASELHRDAGGELHLDYIAPLVVREGAEPRPVGAVILRSPVETLLLPMARRWPTSTATGEVLFARKEGREAVILSGIESLEAPPLSLRVPLDTPRLPIAEAIKANRPILVEGRDYRGVEVFAAGRPIRGSDWHLIAKIDREEVLAPLGDLVFWVSLVAIVAVVTVTAAGLLLWRQVQESHRLEVVAEAAEKAKLLRLFYELPFVGMTLVTGKELCWGEVNDRLSEILGYSRAELGKLTWAELTHPEDREAEAASIARLLDGEIDGYRTEKRMVKKDGEVIVASVDVKRARGLEGTADTILATVEDITEQKRQEQEIRSLNADLEARVHERTAALEAANRELESFSYSVSHDLRAPLRAIDGYSRLLAEDHAGALDPEARGFLQSIRAGARTMSQLITDILAYSRLERSAAAREPVSLRAVVDAVLAERAAAIAAAGAVVQADVPDLEVVAERDGLSMALRNLLDNALKFSRKSRPPRVEIGCEEGGDRVTLFVKDNGIGFDMKFHDRIFEIFQRLERGEEYEGSGVGLSMVRRSLTRMGGQVRAESAPGQGATFFLQIPRST